MVRLDLWKCLLKKESFELGFELKSERVGRFRKLAGNEFRTDGEMKLKSVVISVLSIVEKITV